MKNLILTLSAICVVIQFHAQEKPNLTVGSTEYKTLKAAGNLDLNKFKLSYLESVSANSSAKALGGGKPLCASWVEPENESFVLNDDDNFFIDFGFEFDFFGNTYTSCWINDNGNITFDGPNGVFTPEGFPNDAVMLAPFWSDVDLECGTCGSITVDLFDQHIIVTWSEVGFFDNNSSLVNTYQVIFTATGAGILPGDNTVQFSYQDMQWTSGEASGGINGLDGFPATVGANSGNGFDFIQFGQFDHEGEDYDGPFNQEDGVSWLDNQTFLFNANIVSNENLSPIAIGTVGCDSLVLCANDSEILQYTFLAPENDQSMSITIIDDGFPGIETEISEGTPAEVTITLTSGLEAGNYDIEIVVVDNGAPVANTSILINVEVLAIEVPDLDISVGGEILEAVSYCQGQAGVELTGSDGFDSYEWSNGTELQADFFDQGTYFLTGYFMGCDTDAGPINVFEIPIFNPDISLEDDFLCEGETTEISVDNSENYQSIEWDIFNNDGEIISSDLTNDTIEVEPGFYVVQVIDENNCPGSTIIPVVEEIVNIPNTSFSALCDDNTISWNGAWAEPETCVHQIYLYDSEGDTWEGANLQVFIDGTGPFNHNIDNMLSFDPNHAILPYHGQIVEYFWQPGLDDNDIDLTLFDGNGDIVFNTEDGDLLEAGDLPFFTLVADCGFNALEGEWVIDGPEGWSLESESEFNPVEGSNTFSVQEGFIGTYSLTFESTVCNSDISFDLEFSTTPTVTGIDYNACGEVTIEPTYGPASLNGDFEYNWGPNVLNDFDGSPTATVTQSLEYSIEVSNQCGENEYEGLVVITPVPSADLSDVTVCDSETVLLNPGNIAPNSTYVWSNGSTDETISVNSGGEYSVEITNECGTASSSAFITQDFTPSVLPWAFDTLICAEAELNIDPVWNSELNTPIIWNMSYTDTAGVFNSTPLNGTGQSFLFLASQIPDDAEENAVTVSFSTSNSCGSAQGEVLIYEAICFINATNVITPDTDGDQNGQFQGGLNEGWYVFGIDGVKGVEVKIYDRWGALVFEDNNYSNSNPWKGIHKNGSDLTEGVYFYSLKSPRGNDNELTGTITLLRK